MKPRLLLLVLLAAASLPAAAATQVYSWTDANGTKHFTDSPPPPSVNAQKLKVRGSVTSPQEQPPAPPQVVADASKPPEGLPPATTAAVPKQMADTPENRTKQCQTARANLEILKGNYPVSAPAGSDGKAQVLDDAGRQAAVDRANGQVAFYCK
jgi:hypothetical protein